MSTFGELANQGTGDQSLTRGEIITGIAFTDHLADDDTIIGRFRNVGYLEPCISQFAAEDMLAVSFKSPKVTRRLTYILALHQLAEGICESLDETID